MAELTSETNADLNRLAEIKAKGGLLEKLDEQRLRDHQLRRLRRLWLKDQCLTAREPLLPPKKNLSPMHASHVTLHHLSPSLDTDEDVPETFFNRFLDKEEAFWSKHLKFRRLSEYVNHGRDFHEVPKLWAYQMTRFVKLVVPGFIASLPVFYFIKYGGWDMPGMTVYSVPQIFPGDTYMTVRSGDVKFDMRTGQYIPTKDDDEWQRRY